MPEQFIVKMIQSTGFKRMKKTVEKVLCVLMLCNLVLIIPATSAQYGKIAFASNRDHNYEIYVMNDDGTEQKRLTNNIFYENNPT